MSSEVLTPRSEPSAPRTRRRRVPIETVAAVVGLVGFVVVVLGPSLVGLRVFVGLDVVRQVVPFSRADPLNGPVANIFVRDTVDSLLPTYIDFRNRLLGGDLASWLPYSGGGGPSAALPSWALLNPLALPYWLLPTWLAPAFSQLVQIALSAGGMFLFLRRVSCTRAAALVGGTVFVTSGYMIAWVNWPQTKVGAFIPLLFWALERFAQIRTVRAAVPVAVAVAGLVLGGFPAVAGLALYFGGAYLLVRLLAELPAYGVLQSLRAALVAAGAVVVGVGVTAVQLVPFASYLGTLDLSYREDQFSATTPVKYVASALFPQAFFANVYGGDSPFGRTLNPVEVSMHLGSVAVLLVGLAVVGAGAVRRPRGAVSFLLVASVVALWLVFLQGPLASPLSGLPIFSGNPIGRLRAVLGFTAAATAGLGFDVLVRGALTGRRRVFALIGVPVVVIGVGAVGVLVDRAQTPLFGDRVERDVLLACTAVALAGALVMAALRWVRVRRLSLLVIPLLVAVQGVHAVQDFWPTADRDDFYPTTSAHAFLQDTLDGQRIAQTGEVLLPSTTAAYGLRLVGGHQFTAGTWAELLRGIDPNTFVVPTISTFSPLRTDVASSPGLDRMAARYYVSADSAPIPGTVTPTGPAEGTVAVGPSGVSAEIPAQALRGIGFSVTGSVLSPAARVTVSITDARGETVATGERPIPGARVPGDVYVPLAAEDAGSRPGPLTVTVGLSDRLGDALPDLVATAGVARLLVVGPASDGLRLMRVLDGVTIYEREDALPRIRWASRSEVVSDPADRVATVVSGDLPDEETVLSEPGPEAEGGDAGVTVEEDSGDTVRVRVDAERGGYLVLADAVQTDWAVRVDDDAAAIVAADHAFGAVFVPAGTHEVVFSYAPRGRSAGLAISAVSVVVLIGVAVLPVARRRRERPEAAAAPL